MRVSTRGGTEGVAWRGVAARAGCRVSTVLLLYTDWADGGGVGVGIVVVVVVVMGVLRVFVMCQWDIHGPVLPALPRDAQSQCHGGKRGEITAGRCGGSAVWESKPVICCVFRSQEEG